MLKRAKVRGGERRVEGKGIPDRILMSWWKRKGLTRLHMLADPVHDCYKGGARKENFSNTDSF